MVYVYQFQEQLYGAEYKCKILASRTMGCFH